VLPRFPDELPELFPNLLIVQIHSFTIEVVAFEDSLSNLEKLVLFDNKMKKFNINLEEEMTAITELFIENNLLTKIDNDAFKFMNYMQKLSLSRNKITSIHHNAFTEMLTLELLDNKL
jgi:Leucine-rich repeat (LRR) protein